MGCINVKCFLSPCLFNALMASGPALFDLLLNTLAPHHYPHFASGVHRLFLQSLFTKAWRYLQTSSGWHCLQMGPSDGVLKPFDCPKRAWRKCWKTVDDVLLYISKSILFFSTTLPDDAVNKITKTKIKNKIINKKMYQWFQTAMRCMENEWRLLPQAPVFQIFQIKKETKLMLKCVITENSIKISSFIA